MGPSARTSVLIGGGDGAQRLTLGENPGSQEQRLAKGCRGQLTLAEGRAQGRFLLELVGWKPVLLTRFLTCGSRTTERIN